MVKKNLKFVDGENCRQRGKKKGSNGSHFWKGQGLPILFKHCTGEKKKEDISKRGQIFSYKKEENAESLEAGLHRKLPGRAITGADQGVPQYFGRVDGGTGGKKIKPAHGKER